MSRCQTFGLVLIAVLFLAVLSGVPAFAEQAPQAAPPAPSSLSLASCGSSLDLINSKGEICPVTQPESPAPEFMAKPPRIRYCTCGCGATCTTDADCDGGACVNVITCC
jgi:hypothetical protein